MQGLIAAFLLLAFSWLGFRRGLIPFDFLPAFRFLVLYLALPAFVFSTLMEGGSGALFDPRLFLMIGLASVLLYIVYFCIALWGFGWRLERAMLFGHGAVATNSLLLGVPILSLTFGQAISPVVAQIVLFENIFLLPAFMLVADYAMGGGGGARALFRSLIHNQFLWAVGIAILMSALSLNLPAALSEALSLLGRAAAPVAILTVGGILAKTNVRSHLSPALLAVAAKLAFLPALGYGIGLWLGVPTDLLIIMTLFMAMPNAAIFPVFGEEVGFSEFSSSVFILSYMLAFFTLLAWFALLG